MSTLKIIVNAGKGSLLTGDAWVDILVGGERVVEKTEITAPFKFDANQVDPNKIIITRDYDPTVRLTLTVINCAESLGPIQTYNIEFYIDDQPLKLTWQQAIKTKPLRFGGQPNVTIFNPHVGSKEFGGWCSVTDISPGMSITWGLADLIPIRTN